MKNVIVTGAAGFIGANLTEVLSISGYRVFAVVRPDSPNNNRIADLSNVDIIELDIADISQLSQKIPAGTSIEQCYHLVSYGSSRMDFDAGYSNISDALHCLETVAELGCKRWIATGSQDEYGMQERILTEDLMPKPFSAYGSAKVATCYLTKCKASQLKIEWIWGRIHSIYGKYEPRGRLLPDLIFNLKNNIPMSLSSCTQSWDYLYSKDCASALIALGERGASGEIYNIASGSYRPLKEYVESMRSMYGTEVPITYGAPPSPFVSIHSSIEKITRDTGWQPSFSFEEGLREVYG